MVPPAAQAHLLIVEADPAIRDLLQCILEEEGYRTDLAASLDEALAAVRTQAYHLILLDLLPASPQSPLSAARQIQRWAYPTPVGLLSSWELPLAEMHRQRFAFLLPKPFDLDQLLSAVATAVGQRAAQTPSAVPPEQLGVFPALPHSG